MPGVGLMVVVPASEAVYVLQTFSPVLSLNLTEHDTLLVSLHDSDVPPSALSYT